jgi:tetratricopeptide (TPR) repeat protein
MLASSLEIHFAAARPFHRAIARSPCFAGADNEVAPTAYAETLRDAGRRDEALKVFEETMQRFPHDEVVPTAYAHLLAECGRFADAERLLLPAARQPRTRSDWISMHILAMSWLKAGRIDEALSQFERGSKFCSFLEQKRYFDTGQSIALLAAQRADEAARRLEVLANDPTLPREDATNVVLFRIHALAEAGRSGTAKYVMESAKIIDFAASKQMRLANALDERYGLMSGFPASSSKAQKLNEDIATLEFELARPKLWKVPTRRVA